MTNLPFDEAGEPHPPVDVCPSFQRVYDGSVLPF
jgi:hypothetical protein